MYIYVYIYTITYIYIYIYIHAFGQSLMTLYGHEDTVFSAIFSPDSTCLLSASHDGIYMQLHGSLTQSKG